MLKEDGASKITAVCTICQKEFAYHNSTSCLTYHLQRKHPFATGARPQTADTPASSTKATGSKLPVQPSIEAFTTRKVTQEKGDAITTALSKWIAKSIRPLALVEDEGLAEVLSLALDNPSYNTPCRTTIQRRLKEMHLSLQKDMLEALTRQDCVSVTVDYWSSQSNESFLGMTCHYIDENWKARSQVLGVEQSTERHTGERVAAEIQSLLAKWTLSSKVVAIGTDNAANMMSAMQRFGLQIQILPCAAHSLLLAVKKSLQSSGVDSVLAKVRKIVGHIKHSPANLQELKETQKKYGEVEQCLVSSQYHFIILSCFIYCS